MPRGSIQLWRGQVQWTAQFLAASELVRLGYVVSFTMGNHTPIADLVVGSQQKSNLFWVNVKGKSSKVHGWYVHEKTIKNLYYILVSVGEKREADEFFVLDYKIANQLIADDRRQHNRKAGFEQIAKKAAVAYKDAWKRLPRI